MPKDYTDIIKACLKGSSAAQKQLYDNFSGVLYAISLRYSKKEEEAQDILQDSFLKIFNKLHTYKFTGSFEGWMKRIFINTSIEHYRKTNNRKFFVEIDQANEVVFDSTTIDQLATQDLLKVVQKLPDGYRTVFNLYAIEGYNHKEIGKLLGISEGTSKSQLNRARKLLQKKLIELNDLEQGKILKG